MSSKIYTLSDLRGGVRPEISTPFHASFEITKKLKYELFFFVKSLHRCLFLSATVWHECFKGISIPKRARYVHPSAPQGVFCFCFTPLVPFVNAWSPFETPSLPSKNIWNTIFFIRPQMGEKSGDFDKILFFLERVT